MEANPQETNPEAEQSPEKPSHTKLRSETAFDERKRLLFC